MQIENKNSRYKLIRFLIEYLNEYLNKYSDYLFKMLLIGNSGVGKSCLLVRYAVSKKNIKNYPLFNNSSTFMIKYNIYMYLIIYLILGKFL